MIATAYHLHRGARGILLGCGLVIFLFGLVFSLWIAAVGVLFFLFVFWAKVTISDDKVVAQGLGAKTLRKDDVDRIGLLVEPLPMGVVGLLRRIKAGGPSEVCLCWCDKRGKTRSLCVSMYERSEEIVVRVNDMVGLPFEEPTVGISRIQWPKRKPLEQTAASSPS